MYGFVNCSMGLLHLAIPSIPYAIQGQRIQPYKREKIESECELLERKGDNVEKRVWVRITYTRQADCTPPRNYL